MMKSETYFYWNISKKCKKNTFERNFATFSISPNHHESTNFDTNILKIDR